MVIEIEMDDILAEFDELERTFHGEVTSEMQSAGQAGVDYAVRNGSYKNRTGRLRKSNKSSVTDNKSTIDLEMENTAEYASYVEAKGYDVLSGGFLETKKILESKL